jgi:hypothetical protein
LNGQSKKSTLFLMELIIVLLFFSFSAAVCVNIFAKAKLLSEQSYELNKSVIAAQNAAECFAADSDTSLLSSALGGTEDNNTVKVFYGKDWEKTDSANAVYTLSVDLSESGEGMRTACINISRGDTVIYSLNADHYAGQSK